MSGTTPTDPTPRPRLLENDTLWRGIVSAAVMSAFAAVSVISLTRIIPESTLTHDVYATLSTLTTMVVGYWVGSSAGSTKKTAMLANNPPSPVAPGSPTIVQTRILNP